MINFDFPVQGLFMCIQWQYSFWNGTTLFKRNSLVHLNHSYLQARWILKILGRMVLILFNKNKKVKAIKGTLLQSKANISLVCTSYTNMKHKWQILEVLWSSRRRELKSLLEVFGQLIEVIKDKGALGKLEWCLSCR